MVGWLYIHEEVAAPIRMLEADGAGGVITIEVAARFVSDRTMLRRETVVEYRGWPERRLVRCLGAELVGHALMIEAVDVGPIELSAACPADDDRGSAEDWLTVDGKAVCQITGMRTGYRTGGHCLFHVGLAEWRDLRIGEDAPLACIGIRLDACHDNDGSITPLLHAARNTRPGAKAPVIEVVRLRERQRFTVHPIATDWGHESTLVVARVDAASTFGLTASEQTVAAH